MQVNNVNATPSFGASIKSSSALRNFVSHVQNELLPDRCLSKAQVKEMFSPIHHIFPDKKDEVVFTKFIPITTGHFSECDRINLVIGFIKRQCGSQKFGFTFRDQDLYSWDGKIKPVLLHLNDAFSRAKYAFEKRNSIEVTATLREIAKGEY